MAYDVKNLQLYINGEFVDADSPERIETHCPGDGLLLGTLAIANANDVDRAVSSAKAAFDQGEWSDVKNSVNRGRLLRSIADAIRENADSLAELEAMDNGKTITEANLIDVQETAECFEYFASLATQIEGSVIPVPGNVLDFTLREPLGVVGSIIAWNFPLIMAAWKIAPALASGNTIVLKPSELTSLSALKLCEIFNQVNLPAGVVNVITGNGPITGQALVNHPDVAKISFTGSTAVGKLVQQQAANTLKKVTLELGGKSPHIIFADAEIDNAVSATLNGIFFNSGQCCIAGSRLLLHEAIADEFLEKLVARANNIKVGHPLDWDARMGAIANEAQLKKIKSYVAWAKQNGNTILCGGDSPDPLPHKNGFYFNPTIIMAKTPDDKICQEEIFGPVLSVIKFSNTDEAISIANNTPYGLAAGLWTSDIKRAITTAKQLKAGQVWINQYLTLSPWAPHGGYKQSGFGKDLSKYCLQEYTQLKNIYIDLNDGEYISLYE